MELFEQSKISSFQTNLGEFNFQYMGDKAFYSFSYNTKDHENIHRGFQLGCAITLKQKIGNAIVYINENIVKPTRTNCT